MSELTPHEKNVQKLIHMEVFQMICDILREQDFNSDEVRDAFEILDAIEAGEVE